MLTYNLILSPLDLCIQQCVMEISSAGATRWAMPWARCWWWEEIARYVLPLADVEKSFWLLAGEWVGCYYSL